MVLERAQQLPPEQQFLQHVYCGEAFSLVHDPVHGHALWQAARLEVAIACAQPLNQLLVLQAVGLPVTVLVENLAWHVVSDMDGAALGANVSVGLVVGSMVANVGHLVSDVVKGDADGEPVTGLMVGDLVGDTVKGDAVGEPVTGLMVGDLVGDAMKGDAVGEPVAVLMTRRAVPPWYCVAT